MHACRQNKHRLAELIQLSQSTLALANLSMNLRMTSLLNANHSERAILSDAECGTLRGRVRWLSVRSPGVGVCHTTCMTDTEAR